jgi:ferredoxin
MSDWVSREDLRQLVAGWIEVGKKVIGPVEIKPGLVAFRQLASAESLRLGGWGRPANSIKEAVFPRHEALYGYRREKNSIELIDLPETVTEQIVIGAHPCDAAALPILDKVFNWDFADEFYNRRRAATTVVTLACTAHDDECFCTSVGLGPAAEKGSDVMLFEAANGRYAVRAITEKGCALVGEGKAAAGNAPLPQAPAPPSKFDAAQAGAFARDHFDAPFWKEHALACLGCGACAYTCPVCHCFDIVDEKRGGVGIRARNWDACQFPMFTAHASGHNPRYSQGDRQRQRLYHKFFVYPEKFGEILCTGCGNCARNCPVGLGILPVVTEIRDAEPVQA